MNQVKRIEFHFSSQMWNLNSGKENKMYAVNRAIIVFAVVLGAIAQGVAGELHVILPVGLEGLNSNASLSTEEDCTSRASICPRPSHATRDSSLDYRLLTSPGSQPRHSRRNHV